MNRNDIIDGLALLIASAGAEDAKNTLEPQDSQYWYMVGYYIAKYTMSPEDAMALVEREMTNG